MNKKQSEGFNDAARLESIIQKLGSSENGPALLAFAKAANISVKMDAEMNADIPAFTFIEEARIPRGMGKGTTVSLNSSKDDDELARVLEEQLIRRQVAHQTHESLKQKP